MVQTNLVRPTGIIKDYIHSFELRVFDTLKEKIKKPSHAYHEVLISLFIDSKQPPFESIFNNPTPYCCDTSNSSFAGVMGIHTTMKGFFVFHGNFRIFNIQFKPIGFSSIFQIPAKLLNDQFFNAEKLFQHELKQLHEQLPENISFHEMVSLAEKFLERRLESNRKIGQTECIRKASNSIIYQPNAYSIEQLAYHSNMTIKTFERKFTEMVGIPPKLYARIRRFNKALELKQYHSELNWLDVCVQTGYFDLMHLNKDFKAFAGNPPASFFKNTPPVYENIQLIPNNEKDI